MWLLRFIITIFQTKFYSVFHPLVCNCYHLVTTFLYIQINFFFSKCKVSLNKLCTIYFDILHSVTHYFVHSVYKSDIFNDLSIYCRINFLSKKTQTFKFRHSLTRSYFIFFIPTFKVRLNFIRLRRPYILCQLRICTGIRKLAYARRASTSGLK